MAVTTGQTTLPATGARGVARVEWHGPEVADQIIREVEKRLDAAAILVTKAARASMREVKTGENMGPFTRRSAPGEPPASQHGSAGLLGSVTWDKPSQLERRVGTNLNYGLYLELGRRDGVMAARPWLEQALIKSKPAINRMFS